MPNSTALLMPSFGDRDGEAKPSERPPTSSNNETQSNSLAMEEGQLSRPYSAFTKSQKRMIVILITFAAGFSPISSFIFFPTINALSRDLHVSVEKINLTVTSYMIVAGIAPAVMGDMADMAGRRIVYLLTLAIYCGANIGLALQDSWPALFVLRMLQSAGGAAVIAIGYGTVSDIAAPAERGGYVGIVLLGPNIALTIGPVLGGILTQHPSWRWTFWLLAITSGLCLTLMALLLPETSRFIVGNGSRPVSGLQGSIVSYIQQRKGRQQARGSQEDEKQIHYRPDEPAKRKLQIPNPFVSLKILFVRDAFLILSITGIYYMNFSCLQASLSTLMIKLHGYSELQAGLLYLPFGIGSILGAYCSGIIMDHDYKATAKAHGMTIDKRAGDDLSKFPIEKARFKSIWYFISLTGVCTIGYGWALQSRTHIAVPLTLQFIIGLTTALTFNICNTLLTDLHPKSPAAAQAANNIARASLAGAGLAFLQPMLDAVGIGWTFTFFGALCWGCLGFAWM
ncbi:MFS general substrate transporter, partial [Microthyrium microscopicum]